MSINVRDYGAVADGGTDDTNAIRAAIAAVQGGTDRTLYFPHGTYRITGTLDFSSWADDRTGYVVDFGGSTITADLPSNGAAALRFYNNDLIGVRGGLKLLGYRDRDNTGILVDSLQPDGFDIATFERLYVKGFRRGWQLGTPNNRVATVDFRALGVEDCDIGFWINGLVDRCSFREVAVSAVSDSGFKLTQSGNLTFENCTGYGNFPLFSIEGNVHELAFRGCQNEPGGGASNNCFFMKRLVSGSGNGLPRPMVISNCTIESPIMLGNVGSQTGGATQAIFVGCTISSDIRIQFYDYYVELFGCYLWGGAIVHVDGPGSKLTAFGSKMYASNVSVTGPGAQYLVAELVSGNLYPAY
jgi:hypothetical protein